MYYQHFFYIQEHGEENRKYGYVEVHGDLTMYFSASENITTKNMWYVRDK